MSPRMMPAVGGGGGGVGLGNMPGGYTIFRDEAWNTVPVEGGGFVRDWYYDHGDEVVVVTDGTAPYSPSNVMRVRFPTSLPGGSAPTSTRTTFNSGTERYKNLYVGIVGKFSAGFDFVGGGPNAGMKGCWTVGDSNRIQETYWSFDGAAGEFQVIQQNGIDDHWDPNLASADFRDTLGQWWSLEVNQRGSTGDGNFDGGLHVWVNGVKTHQYATGIAYQMSAARKWSEFFIEATYGGGSAHPPAQQDWFIDHVIIAGSDT